MPKLPIKSGCLIEISSTCEKNRSFSLFFVLELRTGTGTSSENSEKSTSPCSSFSCYLSKLNNPFSRLCIAQNGIVSFSNKSPGKGMMLCLDAYTRCSDSASGSCCRDGLALYVLRSACIKHKNTANKSDYKYDQPMPTSSVGMSVATDGFYGLRPCFETNELVADSHAVPFEIRVVTLNPYTMITPPPPPPLPSSLSQPAAKPYTSSKLVVASVPTGRTPLPVTSNTTNTESCDIGMVLEGARLTVAQKEFFRSHGYLHLKQMIDYPVDCTTGCADNNRTHAYTDTDTDSLQQSTTTGSVVRSNYIARVVYRIHHALGTPNELTPGGNQSDASLGKLGGTVSNCKEIRQLVDPSYGNCNYPLDMAVALSAGTAVQHHPLSDHYRSHLKLRRVLADVFGCEENIPNVNALGAQIACRFPENSNEATFPVDPEGCAGGSDDGYFSQQRNARLLYPPLSRHDWHVDGLRQGSRHSFSLLLGVCCSAMKTKHCGNLVIWPGSHKLIHRCYKDDFGGLYTEKLAGLVNQELFPQQQRDTVSADRNDDDDGVVHVPTDISAVSIGENNYQQHQNEPLDLPDLCGPDQEPVQLVGCQPGDIVMLHPDTAHCGGPNYSQHEDSGGQIRIMIYFRLKSNGYRLINPVEGNNTATVTATGKEKLNWSDICEHCKDNMYFDLPGFASI